MDDSLKLHRHLLKANHIGIFLLNDSKEITGSLFLEHIVKPDVVREDADRGWPRVWGG